MKAKSRSYPALGKNPSLSQFLSFHIARSGLTNREIAVACGMRAINMVSMIKRERSRLPLERLASFARTLGIDPFDLFCRWMSEYYHDTWQELAPLLRRSGTGR